MTRVSKIVLQPIPFFYEESWSCSEISFIRVSIRIACGKSCPRYGFLFARYISTKIPRGSPSLAFTGCKVSYYFLLALGNRPVLEDVDSPCKFYAPHDANETLPRASLRFSVPISTLPFLKTRNTISKFIDGFRVSKHFEKSKHRNASTRLLKFEFFGREYLSFPFEKAKFFALLVEICFDKILKRDIESSTRLLSRSKFEFLGRNCTSAEYRNGVNFRFLSRKQSSLPGVTFVRNMGDEEFWQANLWKFFRSPRFRFAPRALSTWSGTGFSLFLERKRLRKRLEKGFGEGKSCETMEVSSN